MRNPDRQRYMNAVNHIEQPEIPMFEIEADMAIVNQIMDAEYDMALHSFELPVDDLIEFNRRLGNDMIYFGHVWHLGRKEMTDEVGRVHYVDGTMKTPDALKEITYPDLEQIERRLETLCNKVDGTGFGVIHGAQTCGFTVPTAIGYQDFCFAVIDEPEFVEDFQKQVHDYTMRELDMLLQYPIDAIKIASGLTTNTGSMISPAMMQDYEYRFIREQAELIRSRGKKVLFHIDGLVTPQIPMLLEMGLDILNPIDASTEGQDIYEIKKEFGSQLTLQGNINIDGVLLHGTPDEVKADVRKHLDTLAVGGGYVMASSHDLHQDIPVENIYAMRDATHEYRFQSS